jgi:hypothetical protein
MPLSYESEIVSSVEDNMTSETSGNKASAAPLSENRYKVSVAKAMVKRVTA